MCALLRIAVCAFLLSDAHTLLDTVVQEYVHPKVKANPISNGVVLLVHPF